jgi:hypothetical protein
MQRTDQRNHRGVQMLGLTPAAPNAQHRGDWMQTYTAKAFYPLSPAVEDIDPLDIAHALSLLCRYGGHSSRFYSVAEHSVLMSHAVAPENALWALLHDAAEAYLGDVIRPLKRALPAYALIEDNVMAFICARFGLDVECPAEVKEADNRILVNERAVLMGPPPLPWASIEDVEPLDVTVEGWPAAVAEATFYDRLMHLANGAAA